MRATNAASNSPMLPSNRIKGARIPSRFKIMWQLSGLERLQIGNDVRDLVRVESELRHGGMVGGNSLRQARLQAVDWKPGVQGVERWSNLERALPDLVDGMALRAMHPHECETALSRRRLLGQRRCARRHHDRGQSDDYFHVTSFSFGRMKRQGLSVLRYAMTSST